MLARLTMVLALLSALPLWSQVQPSATGELGPAAEDEDTQQMIMPSLLNGAEYPTVGADEERTNFITGSVTATGTYLDNVYPGINSAPISDEPVTISPSVSFNRTQSRQQASFTYSPSFTLYQNVTGLNSFDQSAVGSYQVRITPHIAIIARDAFLRTSNVFNTPFPFTTGGISGSTQAPAPALIVPFAEQLNNSANAAVSYQISSRSMIGGGGRFVTYTFPNLIAQSTGIYDSQSNTGTAFYMRRLSNTQDAGMSYNYTKSLDDPSNLRVHSQINQALPYYSLAFARKFSLTGALGAQRTDVAQSGHPTFRSWSAAAYVSFGWQGNKANFAGSYLHTTFAGGGLLGAYTEDSGNFSGGWKLSRNWRVDGSLAYQTTAALSSLLTLNYPGGNSFAGSISTSRSLGDYFAISGGYDRLNQQYTGIPIIAGKPDSDREYVSLTYRISKSLRR
jgi:hypothetical protein